VTQQVVGSDHACDAPKLFQCLSVVNRQQVTTEARIQSVEGPLQGFAGPLQGFPVAKVGHQNAVFSQGAAVIASKALF
jgi:hypothetical protein